MSKQRTFEVSSSSYIVAMLRRGGIEASDHVKKKRQEIAKFRQCQRELVETVQKRAEARSEDRASTSN